jgi:hypothetical protein
VTPENFLLATRDSGYRSTSLAVAEFIDNSVQAGATSVDVEVLRSGDRRFPVELRVIDDGAGMTFETLASALAFGGSSRFDDRTSLGRYGMGLPNGAMSRARRVEVYTWRGPDVLTTWLDLDEVISRHRKLLPPVTPVSRPPFVPDTASGTAVWLRKCDRLEHQRPSTVSRHLTDDLGRIYRHFLAKSLSLCVNGAEVPIVDPLFLLEGAVASGARTFGDTLTYGLSGARGQGNVEVRFSELPLEVWHDLPLDHKRRLGVTNAPPVSVVRANREVDLGWFFMGAKRRENYDDWWRCEVRFDPALDEMFGITHAKQAVAPTEELLQILAPDLEPIARALNSRVRRRFELVKLSSPLGEAERQAARAEPSLPPVRAHGRDISPELRRVLDNADATTSAEGPYRLIVAELQSTAAFEVGVSNGQVVVALNVGHPLFRDLYGPLAASESEKDQVVAKRVALAVLAAARAEVASPTGSDRGRISQFRESWADVLATFFNA